MSNKNTLILGIESSCDDTSVALVRDHKLIDCIVVSSADIQAAFGGVVPEIAAREHEKKFIPLIQELFTRTGTYWREVTHIAYTEKPGLIGCLLVGHIFAKTLALIHDKPLIPVDHICGHIFSIGLTSSLVFPALALVVSGKTTSLYYVKSFTDIELIDSTADNALGEVYDKVARELGFKYPGGPMIDSLFNEQRKVMNLLPHHPNPAQRFSYSGVLSAVKRLWTHIQDTNIDNKKEYVATVFQRWVIGGLIKKIKYWSINKETKTIYVAGGVSANRYLRSELNKLNMDIYLVDKRFACDNAAMIAYYASFLV